MLVMCQVLGVIALSSLFGVSAPVPAMLAVLPRWSDVVVRAHCCIQALNSVVGVVLFCVVAPQPRSACRRLLCASAAGGTPTPSGCANHTERPVAARLFHVEMTDGDTAATAAASARKTGDAECLLGTGVAADANASRMADDVVRPRNLSPHGVEVPLAFDQSSVTVSLLPCQRTCLVASTGSLMPDDVMFAHTSV